MLTRRGWAFVGAALGLYIGARVLGLVQLAVLAGAALALLVAGCVWVRMRAPVLTAHRHLRERLQVGVEGRVDIEIVPGRRTPTLTVADAFDHGRRSARFLLGPVGPGEEANAAYRFPTDRRGRFEVGPLRATITDPFGLASVTRRVLGTEEVIVYPRVFDVAAPPEVGGLDIDRDHRDVRPRIEPTGDFMTLRDYAPGDDLRHVHWRSTARRGHLVVRQNETRRRAPVLLVLDVRPNAHDRASFERAVEACASIATALDRAGRPFQVLWSTGTIVGAAGRRHLANVMDELAIVQPHGPERLVIANGRWRASALIAVTGHTDLRDSTAFGVMVRDGGMLMLVAAADGSTAAPARTRRFRTIAVPAHDVPFPQAWNEAVLRWQRTGNRTSSPSAARA